MYDFINPNWPLEVFPTREDAKMKSILFPWFKLDAIWVLQKRAEDLHSSHFDIVDLLHTHRTHPNT